MQSTDYQTNCADGTRRLLKMDLKKAVFDAAKDGKLRKLKYLLQNKSYEEINYLVSFLTEKTTPVLISCQNGHFDVVEYLVEKCNADVEQIGSVVFDGEDIEAVPPLWCAAAAGHLAIVKYLIKKGAYVNSVTKTNSTPLRAACFDGHLDVVQFLVQNNANIEIANRHGHTCLMIACYKGHYDIAQYLISFDANVNRKTVKGNTALHDCAESGSLDIMELLLKHGAKMDVDSYGMTPLLAASVTGHSHVVEYLIKLPIISTKERIDAIELLGATCVDKKRDMSSAINFWRRAMLVRYEGGELIHPKPMYLSRIAAYENCVEVTTFDQLDSLVSDPDAMRMQSLLVRERILGPAHPDTSYFIRYRGAIYADSGNFERCITLWMYALDMQQQILEPLSPMTQSSLLSFAELFSFMLTDRRPHVAVPFLDVINVFDKAVREVDSGIVYLHRLPSNERDHTCFHRTLVILLHLIYILTRIRDHLTPQEDYLLKKSVYKLVKLDPHGKDSSSLLHMACAKDTSIAGRYPLCSFPSPQVVDLLCEVGTCVGARDMYGNTPLHIAAMETPVLKKSIVKCLLEHGAHFDAVNCEGKNFLHYANEFDMSIIPNPLKYLSLQCLAARVIRQYKINFQGGTIPEALESFVSMH